MEDAAYLDLNILNDMLKDLPLNNDVAHDTCILKVLVEDNALEPDFVFVVRVFGVVIALVSPNQIEEKDTNVISDMFKVLVLYDLVETGEHNLLLLN
jgi:hypothetical protein